MKIVNVYDIVKNYSKLKDEMKKYVANKYDLENDDAEFYNFDIILDKQDQVIANFTIKYYEPTMFKSDSVTFDEFVRETNYDISKQ